MLPSFRALSAIALAITCAGCDRAPGKAGEPPLFTLVPPDSSGVAFVNQLPEDTAFNILTYLYFYNGGGVAAGDVDGDGLADLYFTSNLGPNRLYLNRGDYRFEDVTERSGVAGPGGWKSGVTMADVDGDGRLDIYVSGVSYGALRGRNVLYINRGDGTFADETKRFGLEHAGFSTQAVFFDYDADGDLDMYLLNSSVHTERGPSARPQRQQRHPKAGDRLFRNDGGRFVDVSARAGIYGGVEGYGLGVVASDVNLDGCIDLFIANDFQENDFLYMNNCDGTFTESIAKSMGHTSQFSMGVDAADFNNDGWPDLIVLDMLPEREDILKTAAGAESHDLFDLKLRAGYHPQYARNTLQLNRGGGRFSDIGYLAGVAATDWSWTPLFADLDNDGHKDLFITNGVYRRPNDLDYIAHVGDAGIQASLGRGINQRNLGLTRRMPHVPIANYAFRNNGDLTFTNHARAWGLDQPGFSNGAVYVDLNNSGALDLVVNNINAPAAIYRNHARERDGAHFLQVRLRGASGNTSGIGAKVIAKHGGRTQLLEQMPTRGFQSSVDHRLHFGLGPSDRVDSLIVVWPDRRYQVLADVAADRPITVSHAEASGEYRHPEAATGLFTDATREAGIDFAHRENDFADFRRDPLVPHRLSTEGPALAVGDVNGDGADDVYVGGAKWQPGALYLQLPDGRFRHSPSAALAADSLNEDVDAAFFDADGDGDQDLYVVSGGNESSGRDEALVDLLYLNDGGGAFRRDRDAIPVTFSNGSCVAAADYDGDGRIDLFVGGRVVARRYGMPAASRLLRNEGSGRFRDVTAEMAPMLRDAGMVTAAAWLDHDGDGSLDLVIVGEWMPVRVLAQRAGRFVERTRESGLAGTHGWWNSVNVSDLNRDGKPDLVLGNLGLNSSIRASDGRPARLYVHDFEQNGTLEQILTTYKGDVSYPIAGRDDILRAVPSLRARYPTYASFGASRVEDIFSRADLSRATVLEASTFASSMALNDGQGRFSLRALPPQAQLAPMYASLAEDFDGDGNVDLLLAGNFRGVTPLRGRYDATHGVLLRGAGNGTFKPVESDQGAPIIEGEVRDIKSGMRAGGGRLIFVARNNDRLAVLRANNQPQTSRGPR